MSKYFYLFLIACTVLAPTHCASGCPPGWVPLPNSYTCYLLVSKPATWSIAKATCSSLLPNSELAVIDNGPELQLVAGLVGGDIWVGDEVSTYPYGRQCVKSSLRNGNQQLIAVSCNIPYPYVCELDISPNPCKILSPRVPTALTFYPHPALPYKFIQCTLYGQAFVKLCAKGTVWNQELLTCVIPVPLPIPVPAPYRKRRQHEEYDDSYNDQDADDDGDNYQTQSYRPNKYDDRRPPPQHYKPLYEKYSPFHRTLHYIELSNYYRNKDSKYYGNKDSKYKKGRYHGTQPPPYEQPQQPYDNPVYNAEPYVTDYDKNVIIYDDDDVNTAYTKPGVVPTYPTLPTIPTDPAMPTVPTVPTYPTIPTIPTTTTILPARTMPTAIP